MSTEEPKKGRFATGVVRVAGAWILAGALFKLLLGTPADLPQVVRDLPLDWGLTYRLSIGVELCVAALAFLRPRWAWPVLAAVFLAFDVVLFTQIRAGEASCGCFGSNVPITPELMMAIDSVLLIGMLAARPWSATPRQANAPVLAVVCAVGLLLPWLFDREAQPGGEGGEPGLGRGYVNLSVEDWVGQSIYDTELAKWIEGDPYMLPGDGLWVVWRWTCEHCADHLRELAVSQPDHPFIVLVRLKEPHDNDANRAVFELPQGDHVLEASCPDTVDYVITTPAELLLENTLIVEATEGVGREE